jgi:hypothetical protein
MANVAGGRGRIATVREIADLRRRMGFEAPLAVDLNRVSRQQLASHPFFGSRLADMIIRLRKKTAIRTPDDLLHAGFITFQQLRVLQQVSFGRTPTRPLITTIIGVPSRLFVNEAFRIRVRWLRKSIVRVELPDSVELAARI